MSNLAHAQSRVLEEGVEYSGPVDVHFAGSGDIISIPNGWLAFFELGTLTLLDQTSGIVSIESTSDTRASAIQQLSQPTNIGDGLIYAPEGDVQVAEEVLRSSGSISFEGTKYPAGWTIRLLENGTALGFFYFDQDGSKSVVQQLNTVVNQIASNIGTLEPPEVATSDATISESNVSAISEPHTLENTTSLQSFPSNANIANYAGESSGIFHLGNLRFYAAAIGVSFSFPPELGTAVKDKLGVTDNQLQSGKSVELYYEDKELVIPFSISGGITKDNEILQQLPTALFLNSLENDITIGENRLEILGTQGSDSELVADYKVIRDYDGWFANLRHHMKLGNSGQAIQIQVRFDDHEERIALRLVKTIADSVQFHPENTPNAKVSQSGGYVSDGSDGLAVDSSGSVSGSRSSSMTLCADGTYNFNSSSTTNISMNGISLRTSDTDKHNGTWFPFVSLNGDTLITYIDSTGLYRSKVVSGTLDNLWWGNEKFRTPSNC